MGGTDSEQKCKWPRYQELKETIPKPHVELAVEICQWRSYALEGGHHNKVWHGGQVNDKWLTLHATALYEEQSRTCGLCCILAPESKWDMAKRPLSRRTNGMGQQLWYSCIQNYTSHVNNSRQERPHCVLLKAGICFLRRHLHDGEIEEVIALQNSVEISAILLRRMSLPENFGLIRSHCRWLLFLYN